MRHGREKERLYVCGLISRCHSTCHSTCLVRTTNEHDISLMSRLVSYMCTGPRSVTTARRRKEEVGDSRGYACARAGCSGSYLGDYTPAAVCRCARRRRARMIEDGGDETRGADGADGLIGDGFGGGAGGGGRRRRGTRGVGVTVGGFTGSSPCGRCGGIGFGGSPCPGDGRFCSKRRGQGKNKPSGEEVAVALERQRKYRNAAAAAGVALRKGQAPAAMKAAGRRSAPLQLN